MKKILCGVDLGGTKLSVGLTDEKGMVIDKLVVHDHTDKPEDMVSEQIVLLIKKLVKNNNLVDDQLRGIGVGFAGHLRFRDGVIITSSNLKGFKNYPLRDNIQKHFSVPVILDNDANAQAYGEFRFGAGKGYDTMIFMTISTGIGAGIVIDRKLFRGITGTAGEIGHTIVDADSKRQCTCGNFGCLMTCACGLALPHLFRNKIESGAKTLLDIPENFNFNKVDGHLIRQGLNMGDPVSTDIVMECADYIGIGIYNIFQVFNPPIVVLGGGLLSWGETYLSRVRYKFNELARDMIFDPVKIVESKTGNDVGLLGAASLALE